MTNLAERVVETSATTGTGTYDLAGAPAGMQTFVAGIMASINIERPQQINERGVRHYGRKPVNLFVIRL